MNVTCPKCKREFSGLAEPPVRAGTRWDCPNCKIAVTIPLYCPTCDPPTKPDKQFLPTPEGFLGGQTQRCPKGHTFVVKTSFIETHERLHLFGAEVGQYHQGTRTPALEEALKRSVSGGFCDGAALDWIRRAVLCGKYMYFNAESLLADKKNPMVMRQMRQDKRVAQAQVMVVGSRKNAIPNMVKKAGEIKTQEYNAAFKRYDLLDDSIRASDEDNEVKNEKLVAAKKQYEEEKAIAERMCAERVRRLGALGGRPALENFWRGYATAMDEQREAERSARKKTVASAHGFGKLKVVKSLNSREWPGGIADFAKTILLDPVFLPNRAAFVGVGVPGGGTGHAIAIQRRNTGNEFYLFDPNFGVYSLTGSKVRDAMVYLFTIHYPNSTGGGHDDHPYEKDGKAWGEYAIFESARPAAQGVEVLDV